MPEVSIRDSTLREGLDTPGVSFSPAQRLRIARALADAGVREVELVAPSRVVRDLDGARAVREAGLPLRTSGLIYSAGARAREEVLAARDCLDRFDLLMPVSPRRKPFDRPAKVLVLLELLEHALQLHPEVGVGFPHSLQADADFLVEITQRATERGARRVTVYDTNGGGHFPAVAELVARVCRACDVAVFFHGHNDLGLATANALAAVAAGASGLDVTVNGLGDRAGNASLEQVALALHLQGIRTGIVLRQLKALSDLVERESGVGTPGLAPIVGRFVAHHISASHLEHPDLFEAYDPGLLGIDRTVEPPS